MEEMLEDTFEGMEDQEELEEAAQGEVDKILFEITSGRLFFFFLVSYDHFTTTLPKSKG